LPAFLPDRRVRSDAYFEGGYWLSAVGIFCPLWWVMWILLRFSVGRRGCAILAERATRFKPAADGAVTGCKFGLVVWGDHFFR